jgi:hypothetical protein
MCVCLCVLNLQREARFTVTQSECTLAFHIFSLLLPHFLDIMYIDSLIVIINWVVRALNGDWLKHVVYQAV